MPRVRLLRGVVVAGLAEEAGRVLAVSDSEARRLVLYGDAVVLADPVGGERVAVPMLEHRDTFRRKPR